MQRKGTGKQSVAAQIRAKGGIAELATPANVRYGRAIHRRRGVKIISRTPTKVVAWVGGLEGSVAAGGSQRRRTRLSATARGLTWHCTGNPRKHQIFCKHCVALALAVRRS